MLKKIIQITRNMGLRYVVFRVWYEFRKRTGILKWSYPTHFKKREFISKSDWKSSSRQFFFRDSSEIKPFELSDSGKNKLKNEANTILEGRLTFFSSIVLPFGKEGDPLWLKNEDSGYEYALEHWTKIPDYDPSKGDIKYVWEKSRFSWVYTLIRAEHHLGVESAAFIFSKIDDWLVNNPPNLGPNYVCSQETSLRCMNWIFVLYFYKNHDELTEERFQAIIHSIWVQAKHVEKNLGFSRIAVRNNHAITETFFLYLTGTIFDFYPEANSWKNKGKKYFEEEILFQIYEDGTYLQYSMNYHRVVMQICTWAHFINIRNKQHFSQAVNERISRSLDFLMHCQDTISGQLPNYGANDGALFFPLNSTDFRNYSGQLAVLAGESYYTEIENEDYLEDAIWYGQNPVRGPQERSVISKAFDTGGFYVLRSTGYFSMVRCGNHPNRPSQADNLHLDIWYKGKNILRDGGSYKYNAPEKEIRYFFGSESHNVVLVNGDSQMKKGPRFVWFNWTQSEGGSIREEGDWQIFEGSIRAFGHISEDIRHRRIVRQHLTKPHWEIEDHIIGTDLPCSQVWHPSPEFFEEGFQIECTDETGNKLDLVRNQGWYSGYYGVKESCDQLEFHSAGQKFVTKIVLK